MKKHRRERRPDTNHVRAGSISPKPKVDSQELKDAVNFEIQEACIQESLTDSLQELRDNFSKFLKRMEPHCESDDPNIIGICALDSSSSFFQFDLSAVLNGFAGWMARGVCETEKDRERIEASLVKIENSISLIRKEMKDWLKP